MEPSLYHAFDESLSLLEEERVSLEDCLARYPEYADDLRSLLVLVSELRGTPRAVSSPSAFAAGMQRMLETVPEKDRRTVRPGLFARFAGWASALLGEREVSVARRRTPTLKLALTASTLLVVLAVGGCMLLAGGGALFRSWLYATVDQSATLAQVDGVVEILYADSATWSSAPVDTRLEAGDRIRTAPQSSATLVFFDGSVTGLEAETEVTVAQMSSRRNGDGAIIVLNQWIGQTCNEVQPLSDSASRFEIETPSATIAVRGTDFAADVAADGTTQVMVTRGIVDVTAQHVTVAVLTGQETTVRSGQPPGRVRREPIVTCEPRSTPEPTEEVVGDDEEERTRVPEPTTSTQAPAATPTPTPSPTSAPTPLPPTPIPTSPPPPPPPPPEPTPADEHPPPPEP